MKRIIIAIDSFKDCMTSREISDFLSKQLLERYAELELVIVPIADGGEGMVEALSFGSLTEQRLVSVEVHDPLMRPITSSYIVVDGGQTAIMEMATAAGLELVEIEMRNPLHTTTFGVGEVIVDALSRSVRRIVMGIGGSATNDAGMGMLIALGFRFLDRDGRELFGSGENLDKVDSIDMREVDPRLVGVDFDIACDVNNPFYGENGAAHVFAPQKGADSAAVEQLDRGLRHFAKIVTRTSGCQIDTLSGAGAAGGMGGGAVALLNAGLRSGIDIMLDEVDFDNIINGASLIITGEGKMDRQTLMGKAPFGVLKRGIERHIPVIALAGRIDDSQQLKTAGFSSLFEITPPDMPTEQAVKAEVTQRNITRIIESIDFKKIMSAL